MLNSQAVSVCLHVSVSELVSELQAKWITAVTHACHTGCPLITRKVVVVLVHELCCYSGFPLGYVTISVILNGEHKSHIVYM